MAVMTTPWTGIAFDTSVRISTADWPKAPPFDGRGSVFAWSKLARDWSQIVRWQYGVTGDGGIVAVEIEARARLEMALVTTLAGGLDATVVARLRDNTSGEAMHAYVIRDFISEVKERSMLVKKVETAEKNVAGATDAVVAKDEVTKSKAALAKFDVRIDGGGKPWPVEDMMARLEASYRGVSEAYHRTRMDNEWSGMPRTQVYEEARFLLRGRVVDERTIFYKLQSILPLHYQQGHQLVAVDVGKLVKFCMEQDGREEVRLQRPVGHESFAIGEVGISAVQRKQPALRGDKEKRRKGRCNYCSKEGHWKAECRKRKADLAKEGDSGESSRNFGRFGRSSKHGASSSSVPSGSSPSSYRRSSKHVSSIRPEPQAAPSDWSSESEEFPYVPGISGISGTQRRPPYVELRVAARTVPVFVDCGADVNAISLETIKDWKLEYKAFEKVEPLTAANGGNLRAVGSAEITTKFGDRAVNLNYWVVENLVHSVLIGNNTLADLRIVLDWRKNNLVFGDCVLPFVKPPRGIFNVSIGASVANGEEEIGEVSFKPEPIRAHSEKDADGVKLWSELLELHGFSGTAEQARELRELLVESKELFAHHLARAGQAKLSPTPINIEGTAIAKWCSQRPLSKAEWEVVNVQVAAFLESGAIRPAKESSATENWNSSITLAPKSDGSLRFCIDYRHLNRVTLKAKDPLPRTDMLLREVSGKRWLSKLDVVAAYHQVPLKEEDKPKTAFSTGTQRYEWNVLPFGLTNAPSYFQLRMHQAVGYLKGVHVYMDDLVVATDTFAEHLGVLRTLFARLVDIGIVLNVRKCLFGSVEITFLGWLITTEGKKPHPRNVKPILEMPKPTSSTMVKSFMGMVEYYSSSIPNCSQLLDPLRKVSNGTFAWGEEQQVAFDKAKICLATLPSLSYFREGALTIIFTDASKTGIGAALVQIILNIEKPIQFWSRSATSAERDYSATKLELLAMRDAVRAFRPFIFGRHFEIHTDHQPLLGLLKTGQPQPSSIITRWVLELSAFDVTIKYKKGSSNSLADALSRLSVSALSLSIPSWSQATRSDTIGRKLIEAAAQRNARVIEEKGVVFVLNRAGNRLLYVPDKLRQMVMEEHHNGRFGGHFGADKTAGAILRFYFWPTMREDVKAFCEACVACVQKKRTREDHGIPANIPFGEPWEVIALDTIGPLPTTSAGNRFILVAIDVFTKSVEVFPSPDNTADAVIKLLFNQVIARHGVPSVVLSDNGSNYVAAAVKVMYQVFGITGKTATPYNPQGNGVVERFNKTLNGLLRLACGGDLSDDWDVRLPACSFAYHKTPHSSTGHSPFFMEHGREPKLGLVAITDISSSDRTPDDYLSLLKTTIDSAHELAKDAILRQQERRNAAMEKKPQTRLDPGELVWVHFDQTEGSSKLYWAWKGPYRVVQRYSDQVYEVESTDGTPGLRRVNIRRLRRCSQAVELPERPNRLYIPEAHIALNLKKPQKKAEPRLVDPALPQVSKSTPSDITISSSPSTTLAIPTLDASRQTKRARGRPRKVAETTGSSSQVHVPAPTEITTVVPPTIISTKIATPAKTPVKTVPQRELTTPLKLDIPIIALSPTPVITPETMLPDQHPTTSTPTEDDQSMRRSARSHKVVSYKDLDRGTV